MDKLQVLYWLNRRLRGLEAAGAPMTAEEMAKKGLTYEQRRQHLDTRSAISEQFADELAAYQRAVEIVKKYG